MSNEYSSPYDAFAWLYDRHWQEFTNQVYPLLEEWVLHLIPKGEHILDLGCGTGRLAARLGKEGFRVTGVDRSTAMLAHARERAPQGNFIRADIRSFSPGRRFSAALCIYDTANHLLELGEVRQLFKNVYRALQPGGWFFFDVNMRTAFELNWQTATAFVEDSYVGALRMSWDSKEQLGTMKITVFRLKAGTWHRSDAVIRERCYSTEELERTLESAGFTAVEKHYAAEVTMLGRQFFVCRKSKFRLN
jgi:SAM-dependent methyltransferase